MQVFPGRRTAAIEGDFLVFLIGMRLNKLMRVDKWIPTALAMPRMLKELANQPELGLLHVESFIGGRTVMTVQYWRSFDPLHAYAHSKDMQHLPAWAAFNRRARGNGAVGIYHETYLVKAGQFECIHVNMPRQGLLRAASSVSISGTSETAKQRLSPAEDSQLNLK